MFPQLKFRQSEDFERGYLKFQLSPYGGCRRIPEDLQPYCKSKKLPGEALAKIETAVKAVKKLSTGDLLGFEHAVEKHRDSLDVFFSRFKETDVPNAVDAFIVHYGASGSYFPPRACEDYLPGDTFRISRRINSNVDFLQTVVHEVIHLCIYKKIQIGLGLEYEETEHYVDSVCATSDLEKIYGKYEPQDGMYPRENLDDSTVWKPGCRPTIPGY
jgi:hypothetical protein